MKPNRIELLSNTTRSIIVMGVSGCGKSTIASRLAAALTKLPAQQALNWTFADADHFHPPANVEKMRRAEPLNDDDRQPWLINLNRHLIDRSEAGLGTVLACSALKQNYRDILSKGLSNAVFVHLRGSFEVIAKRMAARSNHYMPTALLTSQFETLEIPENAVTVDINMSVDQIVSDLTAQLL